MLNVKEKQRVAKLHKEIWDEEHNGKQGSFNRRLIPLYREMQELYKKQEK